MRNKCRNRSLSLSLTSFVFSDTKKCVKAAQCWLTWNICENLEDLARLCLHALSAQFGFVDFETKNKKEKKKTRKALQANKNAVQQQQQQKYKEIHVAKTH